MLISEAVAISTAPDRREKLALRVLQLGALAVVLAAAEYKAFELDRYFIPKELALHLTAFLAGVLALRTFRRTYFTRVDGMLLAYLALSAVSAVLAVNHWQALRALTVSVSGVCIFWAARAVRESGLARPLLKGLALAVIVGAITSLLQTYGVDTDLFSINRAPGGTLGNRNFIAHLAAFGLPLVLFITLSATRMRSYLMGAIGVAIIVAVLVLTRSRAAWLAFIAVLAILALALVVSRPLRTHGRVWMRLAGVLVLCAVGVGVVVFAPNSLHWRSDNPYLESMKSVANYQEGSGRGRLIQYRRSLKMATSHALFGVGPGNWSVVYPEHAARRDPSLSRDQPGTTSNPWPSSDWVAFVSERGFLAALLLLFGFFGIAVQSGWRLLHAADADEALTAATLLGVIAATTVSGAFDAVLLLALPTLLVWAALGALWTPSTSRLRAPRASALAALALIAGLGALRSAAQVVGMGLYSTRSDRFSLSIASMIDPGNYRLQLRLARPGSGLKRSARCKHARAAHELYPSARAARNLNASCK
ncbi:MAG TPA: O-antigen ligase family protein [Longimicrobiales bacterium]